LTEITWVFCESVSMMIAIVSQPSLKKWSVWRASESREKPLNEVWPLVLRPLLWRCLDILSVSLARHEVFIAAKKLPDDEKLWLE
tara:strand:- start:143 stop:397 length:255 start_codon:yes stop_codon:yes gene_type:complete